MHEKLSGLYAITDATQSDIQKLILDVEQALLGGARIIQFRDKSNDQQQRLKTANQLRKLTRQYDALFIINDDPQLAKSANADGVHLGQDDINITAARALLGDDSIIGVSCYNRFDLAQQAVASGANYIAFGRFFPSRTKPNAPTAKAELLSRAQQELKIPTVAIGGITAINGRDLINAGANMLAVVDGLFGKADTLDAARQYQSLFNTH